MTTMATRRPRRNPRALAALTVLGVLGLAFLLGVWGAWAGWIGQVILLILLIPVLALVIDYRYGLILSILILPYTNAPLLKGLGLLTVTNLLLMGTFCAILLRWVLARMGSREFHLLLPKPVFWLYLLPIMIGMMIGTPYLAEIPQHFIDAQGYERWGPRQYWISYWFKGMLFVFFALALGGAVIERGDGKTFIRTALIAAAIFAVIVLALVATKGVGLNQLQADRGFLAMTGRHNTEAGFLLACALILALFMREYLRTPGVRTAMLALIALLTTAMLLTFTRGAILVMAVVMLYYVWHFRRPMVLVGATFVVALVVIAMPDAVRDRMLQGIDPEATARVGTVSAGGDALTMGRTWAWAQLAEEIPKAPAFGRGVLSTQWSDLVKRGTFLAFHTHNMYLAIVMDLGFAGLAAMAAFFYVLWRLFGRLRAREDLSPLERGFFAGSRALLIAVLVWGVGNGQYFPIPEQIFVWIAIGLGFGYERALQRRATSEPASGPSAPSRVRAPGARAPA